MGWLTRIMIGVVALSATAACARAAETVTSNCSDNVQQFWTSFRQAAAAGDARGLAALSKFPLQVEGTSDESLPPIAAAADFEHRIPALLDADTGLRESAYPMRQLIAETAQPPDVQCAGAAGAFRVGNMAFERSGDTWRLVKIYTE